MIKIELHWCSPFSLTLKRNHFLNKHCQTNYFVLANDFCSLCFAYYYLHDKYHFSDIDECLSKPCKNGGYCQNLLNRYTCDCLPGYTGPNCQTGQFSRLFDPTYRVFHNLCYAQQISDVVVEKKVLFSLNIPNLFTIIRLKHQKRFIQNNLLCSKRTKPTHQKACYASN